jgi:adenylate cyclase, class 2
MPGAPQYHETEIKLAYRGTAEAARTMIEQHGYSLIEPRTLESDQLFDRAEELRASDRLLRLRRSGNKTTVTYKGPGLRERHKSREEIEFDVSDAAAFTLVLERLGYHPGFRYEKYRTKFAAAGEPGLITIDETPIGIYLELEGEPDWIDQTAARLGHINTQYLTCSYASLYREYLQTNPLAPKNMVFV